MAASWVARQNVLGTDYPYPWTLLAVEHVLATPNLTDDERVAILRRDCFISACK